METNIKDYQHDFWIIAFTIECSANFFALFVSSSIIINSFRNSNTAKLDYETANLNTKSADKSSEEFTFRNNPETNPQNKCLLDDKTKNFEIETKQNSTTVNKKEEIIENKNYQFNDNSKNYKKEEKLEEELENEEHL